MATNKELINSQQFDDAISEGALLKKDIVTSYKKQNKSNFQRFSEVMFESNPELKHIASTKKKNRSEADKQKLQDFKKEIRAMYNQCQVLSMKEIVEDGKRTKVQKIIDKLIPVIDILRYLNNDILEKELNLRGYSLKSKNTLEDRYPGLSNDNSHKAIEEIFNTATSIKTKVEDDNQHIKDDIFQTKVPTDLQYDKKTNNSGIKQSDFRKLVDMKTKLLLAQTKEAKDKANDKIVKAAGDKQFEVARAELVRDKLVNMK